MISVIHQLQNLNESNKLSFTSNQGKVSDGIIPFTSFIIYIRATCNTLREMQRTERD